jgi:hypothetical protein
MLNYFAYEQMECCLSTFYAFPNAIYKRVGFFVLIYQFVSNKRLFEEEVAFNDKHDF